MENTLRRDRNRIVTAVAQLQTDAEQIETLTTPGRAFERLLDDVLSYGWAEDQVEDPERWDGLQ